MNLELIVGAVHRAAAMAEEGERDSLTNLANALAAFDDALSRSLSVDSDLAAAWALHDALAS